MNFKEFLFISNFVCKSKIVSGIAKDLTKLREDFLTFDIWEGDD